MKIAVEAGRGVECDGQLLEKKAISLNVGKLSYWLSQRKFDGLQFLSSFRSQYRGRVRGPMRKRRRGEDVATSNATAEEKTVSFRVNSLTKA